MASESVQGRQERWRQGIIQARQHHLMPSISGSWLSSEVPDTTFCHLESHGVRFTDRRLTEAQGQHGFLLTSLKSLYSKWLFIPSREMKEGLINIQNEGTAAAPGSSKISPED